jgi:hypothetical protein
VPAESQEPRLIALYQRLERAVMPTTNQSDESLVALEPQKRRAPGERGNAG